MDHDSNDEDAPNEQIASDEDLESSNGDELEEEAPEDLSEESEGAEDDEADEDFRGPNASRSRVSMRNVRGTAVRGRAGRKVTGASSSRVTKPRQRNGIGGTLADRNADADNDNRVARTTSRSKDDFEIEADNILFSAYEP